MRQQGNRLNCQDQPCRHTHCHKKYSIVIRPTTPTNALSNVPFDHINVIRIIAKQISMNRYFFTLLIVKYSDFYYVKYTVK